MIKAGSGTATTTANDVPEVFWHEVQWQIPVKSGSASARYRTLPQEQPPSIFAMPFSRVHAGTSLADFQLRGNRRIQGHTIFASNGGRRSGASNSTTQRSGSNFT